MGSPLLPARTARFRGRVLRAFCEDLARFHYIDRDTQVGVCPCCDGWLGIDFAGRAPRCALRCEHGCHQSDIWRQAFRR